MKKILEQKIRNIAEELQESEILPFFVVPEIRVERPKDEQFGEYTTNIALMLAKLVKKSPMEVAKLFQEKLVSAEFEKVEVVNPGHINFYCTNQYFQEKVLEIVEKKTGVAVANGIPEKIMVEFSQPNTHKEFHIGHLRNVFIGSTLVNTLRLNGKQVIAANYIGDTGTHIAKCLWGLQMFHSTEDIDDIPNKAEFLGKVYAEASIKIADNPEYADAFKEVQKKFDAGDPTLLALWEKTKQWSMDEFENIYNKLDVIFDEYFFESIEEQAGKKILTELLDKGIAVYSEGAVIVNLEQYNLGVLVLVRKDGGVLYGLKDIPLAKEKFGKFGIETSIVVVDIRQSLYFQQLFKILELYGFHKKMIHYGYEFVALKGGESMASRKGNVVPARLLIEQVTQKVIDRFPETLQAEKIAIGAIRFYMLRHSATNKIEFDIDESVKLEGATGPYVQYAYARIGSILAKARTSGFSFEDGTRVSAQSLQKSEKDLIRQLTRFHEVVEDVAETYEVHKIAHYALILADRFHSFYNDCKVIDVENRPQSMERLKLIQAVQIVLKETLDLLGIEALEKM